jgi:nucleotide-binding universal stress UspA family protein
MCNRAVTHGRSRITEEGDMYRTIIAGCNGRERGRGAVSFAHAISSATGARLLLVGVHHHPPLPFPDSYANQRDTLEHELRAVRDELAPEALVRVEADLSPAHALRRVAAAENADLLVVGSRHRRRLQRIVESDQAMQVLHGASCAVAVAPDPVAPRSELHRIGVGIDATPESALALVMARELAQHTGARLSLHAVVDEAIPGWVGLSPTPSYAEALQAMTDDRRVAAEELLARRLEACEGVTADGGVVVGDPAGELILVTEGLDLLVLGSRRWGPVRRLALGSTSERAIRHAACPVLVPPRHAEAEHLHLPPAVFEATV